jgi:mRNA interferase MazF
MVIQRFAVYLITLDPRVEIQKTRPCVVISPNEMNAAIQTVIIAPMTTKSRAYPSRVSYRFEDRDAQIVLDQIRTVDKRRLIKPLGMLDAATQRQVLQVLADLFAE